MDAKSPGVHRLPKRAGASPAIRRTKHSRRDAAIRVVREAWAKGNLAAPCLADQVAELAALAVRAWRRLRRSVPPTAERLAAALLEGESEAETARLVKPMQELAAELLRAFENG